jgi:hypothetical protein
MKRIFGDVREVLENPKRTALLVAILMGGFTKEEIRGISLAAEFLIWKRGQNVEGEKKCK